MELYCDLISGKVLRYNYLWPQMRKSVVASVFKTGIPKYQVEEKVREMYIKDVKSEKRKAKSERKSWQSKTSLILLKVNVWCWKSASFILDLE